MRSTWCSLGFGARLRFNFLTRKIESFGFAQKNANKFLFSLSLKDWLIENILERLYEYQTLCVLGL